MTPKILVYGAQQTLASQYVRNCVVALRTVGEPEMTSSAVELQGAMVGDTTLTVVVIFSANDWIFDLVRKAREKGSKTPVVFVPMTPLSWRLPALTVLEEHTTPEKLTEVIHHVARG